MFSVAKAKRQQQMFSVAKAKRQQQLRQGENDIQGFPVENLSLYLIGKQESEEGNEKNSICFII